MIKPGQRVKFSYDGLSACGFVAGQTTSGAWSIHVEPEQGLHEDRSETFPGHSFWSVPEQFLAILSWEQEDI